MKKYTLITVVMAVSLIIGYFYIYPAGAYDQQPTRVTEISDYPPGVTLHAVAWNERDYSYAIAVGNDSGGYSVIYRYWSMNSTWEPIWTGEGGEVFYDVVYDTFSHNGTFMVVGDFGYASRAYVIYDAGSSPVIKDLGTSPPGEGFTGAAFDRYTGPEGTLVAVGTPYSDSHGIIAWHNMSESRDVWYMMSLPQGEILEDVTMNYDSGTPLIVAVGYNVSTGSAVAYACNYNEVYGLNVPPHAKRFNAIDWKPNGGYGIVVGEDTGGNGMAWRIFDIRETRYISYYNRTSGYESLKIAHWDGYVWKTSVVDSSQYAGYYTSIALDHRGLPHISYYNGGDTTLNHAYFRAGSWNIERVDNNGNVGQYSSIAIDSKDHIHISYFDSTNHALKYAYYDGSSWTTSTIDSSHAGWDTSIAVDSNDKVHISYYDDTNGDLKYATNADGSWQVELVDSQYDVGRFNSIAIDSSDNPHISYLDSGVGGLKYASKSEGSWNKEYAVTGASGQYTSLALDRDDSPHISYIHNGLQYIEKTSGSWSSSVLIDGNADSYTSIELGIDGTPRISYYDDTNKNLMFAYYDENSDTWKTEVVDSYGDVGDYSSLAVGMEASYAPMKSSDIPPVLRDVDWDDGEGGALLVGDNGAVYIHYSGDFRIYNWSQPDVKINFKGVGVKSPDSPGYGLATGSSSGAIVSYQVYDTSTKVGVKAVKPHINELRLEDRNGFNRSNQQVDVGNYYYFYINGSYSEGWERVQIDIYAWYDFDNENQRYNETPGANINFHLRYTPDPVDPYNNSGTWVLLWPSSTHPTITLGSCIQQVVDNPAGGVKGQNDGQDFYLLWANITFHEQVRYAPGPSIVGGTWNNSTNQSDSAQSFNDAKSWNFNVSITDTTNSVTTTKYDEFGIYAYTEITVSNNPSGAGAPGNTVNLSPSSHVGIRSNRDYLVKVNITDLKNATGGRIIPRTSVEVLNPTSGGDSGASYAYTWRAFEGDYPIYIWGNNETGSPMQALDYGTCSAGYTYGYDASTTYTVVDWRITIPPTTPEDEYTATVSFEITY